MKWYILESNITTVEVSGDSKNIKSIYKFVINHFFNSDRNVYLIKDDRIIGIINYESFIKNKFDFKKMIIKDYNSVNESSSDEEILSTFLSSNYIYLPFLDRNGHILYELKTIKQNDDLWITKKRWEDLYKHNDKVVKTLHEYSFKNIYVIGSLKSKLYNYIIINTKFNCFKMSPNRNDFIEILNDSNNLIIDTDNINLEYKKWIVDLVKYNNYNISRQYITLKELCDYSELIYFKSFYNNPDFSTLIFEFQTPDDLINLSFNEKLRISFDKHYRYYYSHLDDPEISKVVKKVLGKSFTAEFINSRNDMTGSVLRNSVCYLADSNNPYCKVINGLRYTANKNKDYLNKINIFGACIVYGAVVDDDNTIPSLIQKKINTTKYSYEVENYGARAIDFYENIRTADSLNIRKDDIFIFVVSPKERKSLEKIGINNIHKFSDVINSHPLLHDYFMGEPVHCNAKANKIISDYIFKFLVNYLKYENNKPELIKSSQIIKTNDYNKNHELIKYLKFLKLKKRNTKNNGAIMMNCNPFTYGHLKLIEYASKKVETLYVFVVQEDKSYFKFQDRLKMVIESCKSIPNVVVLQSGTIFGTFMTFQAYFEKETNADVEVDASLDIELFASYVAPILNISKRFVGDEPVDKVTQQYNKDLQEILPSYDIDVYIIPRFQIDNQIISAKTVRQAIKEKDTILLKKIVPPATYSIIKEKYLERGEL